MKAAADAAKAEFGTVHIVVNNAGSRIKRQERQITWPDADWIDDLNLKTIGMLRVTQSFMPIMPPDWTGRIINISGIAGSSVHRRADARPQQLGDEPRDHLPGAATWRAEKITVNTVIPGLIATEWRHGWAENMGKQQGKSKEQFLDDICREWGIVRGAGERWKKSPTWSSSSRPIAPSTSTARASRSTAATRST